MTRINKEILSFLLKGNLPNESPNAVQQARAPQKSDMSNLKTSRADLPAAGNGEQPQQPKVQPVRVEQKVGRNEPCPCGSGKKFKNCHGK